MGKGGVILCKGKRLFQLDSTLSDGDIYSLVLLFTGMLLKSSCIEHLDDKDGSYQICGDLYLGSLRDCAPRSFWPVVALAGFGSGTGSGRGRMDEPHYLTSAQDALFQYDVATEGEFAGVSFFFSNLPFYI